MKKVIKFIKNNILGFLVGLSLCLNGVVIAENIITANQVTYNDSTVQTELDSLFDAVDINEKMVAMEQRIVELENNSLTVNETYPVGSIFISTTNTNPSTIFSGTTWERYGVGKTLVSTDGTSGQTGGSNTVTLTTNNLPSHSHSYTPSGSVSSTFTGSSSTTNQVDLNHTHSVVGNTGNQSANHTHSIPALSGNTNKTGNHTHTPYLHSGYDGLNRTFNAASVANSAVGTSGSKTGVTLDGDTAWSGILSTNGAHTHTVTTVANTTGNNSANHYHSISFTSGYMSANNKHSHTVTPSGSVSSTFTGTKTSTENTGSGKSFSVQNPYITVYMWKRTA